MFRSWACMLSIWIHFDNLIVRSQKNICDKWTCAVVESLWISYLSIEHFSWTADNTQVYSFIGFVNLQVRCQDNDWLRSQYKGNLHSSCTWGTSCSSLTFLYYATTFIWYPLQQARHHADHYGDVIMGSISSQITSLTIVYSTVYSDADQRKHQSSASLAFVWGIHRGPVNSPHKWTVTRKMCPFDDVIMWGAFKGWTVISSKLVISTAVAQTHNSWWYHGMETISALLTLCEGNPPVDSAHKGPEIRNFNSSILLTYTSCWNAWWFEKRWHQCDFIVMQPTYGFRDDQEYPVFQDLVIKRA